MKLVWSIEARATLKSIHAHIAADAPQAADRTIARIVARTQLLIQLPRADRAVAEIGRIEVREVLMRPYRVVFIIQADTVHVLTVLHYRQRLSRNPAWLPHT